MGAYLSTPSVEKKSDDFNDSEKFSYGVSGMQGWRISMEDAHNCVPSLEENASFFGVYDGHGGSEVATYCALHFADVLKETNAYKDKDYKTALEETFMHIDKTLIEPETIWELKVLADRDPDDGPPTAIEYKAKDEEEEYDEDETKLLYEEATMNIEDLLARYGKAANETKSSLDKFKESSKKETEHSSDKKEESPGLSKEEAKPSSSSPSSSKQPTRKSNRVASTTTPADDVGSSSFNGVKDETGSGGAVGSSSSQPETGDKATLSSDVTNGPITMEKTKAESEQISLNESDMKLAKGDPGEEKSVTKKVNAKIKPPTKATTTKLTLSNLQTLVGEDITEDDEDSDSEDGFESDEAVGGSSDSDQEESSEEEEDDDDDEEDLDVMEFPTTTPSSTIEEPGKDSGTTAVVALLKGRDLYVANAGDSRCVLCRNGKAVDMSEDHKPEDETEIKRIKAAGGHVNIQGRVNGGLNLSRAIGDHCYKTNSALDLKDQMISAMPDIKTARLQPGDDFMVLACDGIWNVFSSQEVVDFIRTRLPIPDGTESGLKLSTICEELFDISLAPDTMGDGTGCDNMTCILVRFNQSWLKKCEEDDPTPAVKMISHSGQQNSIQEDDTTPNNQSIPENRNSTIGHDGNGIFTDKTVIKTVDSKCSSSEKCSKAESDTSQSGHKRARTENDHTEDTMFDATDTTEENARKRPKVV